jgi:glutaredoxin/glutathione-dependent peroxiredoxin
MTIKIGDKLPQIEFSSPGADGPVKLSTIDVFKGKRVVLVAVPGAFTPTCDAMHLPGYVMDHDAIKAKGIDTIACTSVNDVFVMKAWSKASQADGKVLMLADGNGTFAKAVGLSFDLAVAGMGERSRRYSMLVEDGVVKTLNIEEKGGVTVSGSETILTQI